MALNKSMDIVWRRLRERGALPRADVPQDYRMPLFPNPPDRLYNYATLMSTTANDAYYETTLAGLGDLRGSSPTLANRRIAVVGAGMAGTTLVRELTKLGFENVTLIEASDRIGGRLYSIEPSNATATQNATTVSEMGAMRMPFFEEALSASGRSGHNSIFAHLTDIYNVSHVDFPNPGQPWDITKGTGIYLNNGFGQNPDLAGSQGIVMWDYESGQDGSPVPGDPDDILNKLLDKWTKFSEAILTKAVEAWNAIDSSLNPIEFNEQWRLTFWDDLTADYEGLSFYQVVTMSDDPEEGEVLGMGMTTEEANLFYVIGAGDGSWGAFYRVSAMYVITTLLFGYGTDHQSPGAPADPPAQRGYNDSYGQDGQDLVYKGLQSYPEMNLTQDAAYAPTDPQPGVTGPFLPHIELTPPGTVPQEGQYLLLNTRVVNVSGGDLNQPVTLTWETDYEDPAGGSTLYTASHNFDDVFFTVSPWCMIKDVNVRAQEIGTEMKRSMAVSHSIASVKVILPLKEYYFSQSEDVPVDPYVPQMLATDTIMLQVYAYSKPNDNAADGSGFDPGVLVISYTWEDDSRKILADGDDLALANDMLKQFGQCLIDGKNETGIDNETDFETWCNKYIQGYSNGSVTEAEVIHWEKEPNYRGCSKLYSPGTINDNTLMYDYNRLAAKDLTPTGNIYFAGDMYSFESGWTEGALRTAMDALIWYLDKHHGWFDAGKIYYPDMDSDILPKDDKEKPKKSKKTAGKSKK